MLHLFLYIFYIINQPHFYGNFNNKVKSNMNGHFSAKSLCKDGTVRPSGTWRGRASLASPGEGEREENDAEKSTLALAVAGSESFEN